MAKLTDKNRIISLGTDNPLHTAHSSSLNSTGSTPINPPVGVAMESPAFQSPVYKNLAQPCSPVEDKMKAGYKLINDQKKDIARMMNKLADLKAAKEEKDVAINQLYQMVEQVQPLLTQLSGWKEKLTAEERELLKKLTHVRSVSLSGIPEEDDRYYEKESWKKH